MQTKRKPVNVHPEDLFLDALVGKQITLVCEDESPITTYLAWVGKYAIGVRDERTSLVFKHAIKTIREA